MRNDRNEPIVFNITWVTRFKNRSYKIYFPNSRDNTMSGKWKVKKKMGNLIELWQLYKQRTDILTSQLENIYFFLKSRLNEI